MTITIHHPPACGTFRNALALIRNAGIELLADTGLSDDQPPDAMLANPILINRPFVVTGCLQVADRLAAAGDRQPAADPGAARSPTGS